MAERAISGPLDSTLAMARDPYRWMKRHFERLQTDCFSTRVMGRKVICLRGPDAAKVFYDGEKFQRRGAAPLNLTLTLLGRGGVQGLDGQSHRHRKQMFLSLLESERVAQLAQLVRSQWRDVAKRWSPDQTTQLYSTAAEVIFRSVCQWSGVLISDEEFPKRLQQIMAMYEHADSLGPRGLWTIGARQRAQNWLSGLIEKIRAGEAVPPAESAAFVISHHRDLTGELLPTRVAAVEMLNVLRPVTAVAVFVAQAMQALIVWPEERERLLSGGRDELQRFTQEVRRYFPFFPAALAQVRQNFEWSGQHFTKGTHVLLDLYATNHHPAHWVKPELFQPERFLEMPGMYQFIPQGGGDPATGHRCPGDPVSTVLIEESMEFLLRELDYHIPQQDLQLDWKDMPALPRSRILLSDVRLKP